MKFPLPCSHFRPSIHLPVHPNWHELLFIFLPPVSCVVGNYSLISSSSESPVWWSATLLLIERVQCKKWIHSVWWSSLHTGLSQQMISWLSISLLTLVLQAEVSPVTSTTVYEASGGVRKGAHSKPGSQSEFYVTGTSLQWLLLVVVHFSKRGLRKTIYWLEQVVRLARIGDIGIWSWEYEFQVIAFTFAKVSKGGKILKLLENQCNVMET